MTGKALEVIQEGGATVAPRSAEETLALAKKLPSLAEASFGELMLLAQQLVPTGFLPDHIQTPGQCVAIILAGRELGMQPMRALRSIQLVKGKVTENADSMLARFKTDGGRAVWKELTETKAVLYLKHRNGDEHTETFTLEDAQRAGLTKASSRGEPSMFSKYPKAMLRSRCITAGLKSIGWEGGAGAYDPEELGVPIPSAGEAGEPAPAAAASAPGSWQRPEGSPPPAPEKLIETLEEAQKLVIPGGPKSWGGHGGKLFGEVSLSVLKAMWKWADKLIAEEGTKGNEPEVKVVNWKKGAELLIKAAPPSEKEAKPAQGTGTAGTTCCDVARATEGVDHDPDCDNYVDDDLPF